YYTALALLPLLLILLSAAGYFFRATHLGQDARETVLAAIGDQFSPALEQQVKLVFDQVEGQAAVQGPLGFLTLVAVSMALFVQIEVAFNRIFHTAPSPRLGLLGTARRVLLVRLRAFLMLLSLTGVLVVVFLTGGFLTALNASLSKAWELPPWTPWLMQLAAAFTLNTLAFTLLYYVIPNADTSFRHSLWGGALAALTWEMGRQALASFVIGQRYSNAYGVVGAFIAVMLWAYYGAYVVLLGAEFVQTISENDQSASQPA
ncbi:MAG: YihY/virulence factor BrkB family protein, partial [Planctomycetales bacterium]|nr:YihY/virulence factor BrkB family protein [Planctomycetales bacterium]